METALRRSPARVLIALAALLLALAGCGARVPREAAKAVPARTAPPVHRTVSADSSVYTFVQAAETLTVALLPGGEGGDEDEDSPGGGIEVTAGHGAPLIVGDELDSPEPWICLDSLSGRDLNGDGHLEVVLERRTGECPLCRALLVVSSVGGRPAVLSPGRGREPCDARSLRGDGFYQLLVPDDSWREAFGFPEGTAPEPLRVWAWNGREYADSTPAFPEFLEAGAEAARARVQALEAAGDTREMWLGRLAEYVLEEGLRGRGRAELDTFRVHLAAHPPAPGPLRVTAVEVRRALERRFQRAPASGAAPSR